MKKWDFFLQENHGSYKKFSLQKKEQEVDVLKALLAKLQKYGRNVDHDRVSVQGVESLWGDCRFIPADWGVIVVDLCYFALFEDFSL